MTLHVYELSPSNPSDHLYMPAIARVHLAAWLTVPLMKTIYYGPPEAYPGYIASMIDRHSKGFREEDDCRFAVCLDDELPSEEELIGSDSSTPMPKGKVIAAIKYYFAEAPSPSPSEPITSTAEESSITTSSSQNSIRTWPPKCNAALAADFWSQLVKGRTMLTSQLGPHVLVDNLYTDPAHHRRGAGSMLMRHACAQADARGLPAMLEASPKGLGVYQSVGFERFAPGEEGEIWVDLRRWEEGGDFGPESTEKRMKEDGGRKGQDWYAQVLMVRPAAAAAK